MCDYSTVSLGCLSSFYVVIALKACACFTACFFFFLGDADRDIPASILDNTVTGEFEVF